MFCFCNIDDVCVIFFNYIFYQLVVGKVLFEGIVYECYGERWIGEKY